MPARDPAWPTLIRRVRSGAVAGYSDRELVDRFVQLNDQAAFEALLDRHGPMVLGVCRRAAGGLGDDAFQATFLVLARRASGVRGSVAGWLYAVARRLSRKAVRSEAARRKREAAVVGRRQDEKGWQELLLLLDEELDRLPDEYRAPLVLCYHQERTQDEAATRLGWSLSTLRRRLERGRELLRRRMARHGVSLSAVALARPSVVTGELREAALGCIQGPAPASVAALAEGGSTMLVLSKWLALATLAAAVAVGVAAVPGPQATRNPVVNPEPPPAEPPLPKGAVARLGTLAFRHGETGYRPTLTFSPDGRHLVSAGAGRVRRWNATTGEAVASVGDGLGPGEMYPITLVTADGRRGRIIEHAIQSRGRSSYWDSAEYDLTTGKQLAKVRIELARGVETSQGVSVGYGVPSVLSPDGKLLLTPTGYGLILHDAATGSYLRFLERRQNQRRFGYDEHAAFLPDGKSVLTNGEGHQFTQFDLQTGLPQREFGIDGQDDPVRHMAVSADGKWLVTQGKSKLRLWDLRRGTVARDLEVPRSKADVGRDSVDTLQFTPDGRLVIAGFGGSGARASSLRCWETETGKPGLSWPAEPSIGTTVAVRPDGQALATMNEAGVIRLWDLRTGQELSRPTGNTSALEAVAFGPAGDTVLTAGRDLSLRELDAATGRAVGTTSRLGPGWYPKFSPRGTYLYAFGGESGPAGFRNWVRVWRARGGKLVLDRDGRVPAFSPDERRLAFVNRGELHVLDMDTRKDLQALKEPAGARDGLHFQSGPQGFLDGGRKLVVVGQDVEVWDVESGKKLSSWSLEEKNVLARPSQKERGLWNRVEYGAVSPDGTRLAFCVLGSKQLPNDFRGATVRVLVFEVGGKPLRAIEVYPGTINPAAVAVSLAFSPDGKRLAGGGARGTTVWYIATGLCTSSRGTGAGSTPWPSAPDGKRLARPARTPPSCSGTCRSRRKNASAKRG
ncbi:MAG: sigma-70 family RNA polymerase sigma factor [Gemmataceae bacterium]